MKKGGFFMNLKKLVSVMLVSAMALSMGACGNSGNSAANTSSNGNSGSKLRIFTNGCARTVFI